ncbi:hypothetical protein INT44_005389 [Umbelopsis vinacea]|uniref:Uncharacterized protein n=1 Tax=Umbelopsis vinacea TaxID=44442 RepID=A0A8H7Q9I1_9FUNG|nr:hypothetical protein INT44_005389 [Umbelopsis vinacea]
MKSTNVRTNRLHLGDENYDMNTVTKDEYGDKGRTSLLVFKMPYIYGFTPWHVLNQRVTGKAKLHYEITVETNVENEFVKVQANRKQTCRVHLFSQ